MLEVPTRFGARLAKESLRDDPVAWTARKKEKSLDDETLNEEPKGDDRNDMMMNVNDVLTCCACL